MNKSKVGAKLRIARLRLGLRQIDVAESVGVSREVVSRAERGQVGSLSIDLVERLADAVNTWFDGDIKSRNGDVDRLVNAAHAALGEQVLSWIAAQPGWRAVAEVSFAVGREFGVVDVLAYHEPTRHLVVIELKTTIWDVDEHLGTLSRKERLATSIGAEQGWDVEHVSVWLIVAASKTNRRRVAAHRALFASRFPVDGRRLRGWFRKPGEPVRGIAFWTDSRQVCTSPTATGRRRAPNAKGHRGRGSGRS